jgi:hypothetical protein
MYCLRFAAKVSASSFINIFNLVWRTDFLLWVSLFVEDSQSSCAPKAEGGPKDTKTVAGVQCPKSTCLALNAVFPRTHP